ncbi:MAG: hypothetical protein ACLTKE_14750 [Coprococcus sp.]
MSLCFDAVNDAADYEGELFLSGRKTDGVFLWEAGPFFAVNDSGGFCGYILHRSSSNKYI